MHTLHGQMRKAELDVEMRRWVRKLALIRRKDTDIVDTTKVSSIFLFGGAQRRSGNGLNFQGGTVVVDLLPTFMY